VTNAAKRKEGGPATKSGRVVASGQVGMYVPRSLEFSVAQAETTPEHLAREMLSLAKLNWNNTQCDGGEPITSLGCATTFA
jgi:hypothetical protein